MKRSDMVEKLALELDDINIENYYDEKGSIWCANLILMAMEEAGMAPPFYDKIQDNNGEKVLIPAREWEDE
jgi:hypothetical protein